MDLNFVRTDRFGLVSKLFIFIFAHKNREVAIMVNVVKSADSDAGRFFIAAVHRVCISEDAKAERVAFYCKGVNLSRLGSVELISLGFSPMEVFLVDVGGEPDPDILKAVKELCFEDAKVAKIVHDCRIESQ